MFRGFERLMSNELQFKKALTKTNTTPGISGISRSYQNNNDSLIRILIGIDALQDKVITFLIEKLPEFMNLPE